jgi:hypothetical protein
MTTVKKGIRKYPSAKKKKGGNERVNKIENAAIPPRVAHCPRVIS